MKKITTLEETASLMISDNYQERFIAEYSQTSIRCAGLRKMLHNWEINGNPGFDTDTPKKIYQMQLESMEQYLALLEARAAIEKISLDYWIRN